MLDSLDEAVLWHAQSGEMGAAGLLLKSFPEAHVEPAIPSALTERLVGSLRECRDLLLQLYLHDYGGTTLLWIEVLKAEDVLKELDRTSSRKGEA